MAAGEGFEPSHTESESAVLPLHNPAKRKSYYTEKTGVVKNFFPAFRGLFLFAAEAENRGERRVRTAAARRGMRSKDPHPPRHDAKSAGKARTAERRGSARGLLDGEQAYAVHAGDLLQRGDERADAAGHAAGVDRERDARLAEHGQALRDGQDVRARAEKTREHRAEHAGLMVEHQLEHGLAAAGRLGGLEHIVLVFVIGAARDADAAYGLADLADPAGFQQTPRFEHLFIVIGQNALVDDQIVVGHSDRLPLYHNHT